MIRSPQPTPLDHLFTQSWLSPLLPDWRFALIESLPASGLEKSGSPDAAIIFQVLLANVRWHDCIPYSRSIVEADSETAPDCEKSGRNWLTSKGTNNASCQEHDLPMV